MTSDVSDRSDVDELKSLEESVRHARRPSSIPELTAAEAHALLQYMDGLEAAKSGETEPGKPSKIVRSDLHSGLNKLIGIAAGIPTLRDNRTEDKREGALNEDNN